MGPATTIHMLLGALLGWAVLSPVAKHQGWASGDVSDWNTGSKGWIVWVSLAIMLADAIVSLGWLVLRPLLFYGKAYGPNFVQGVQQKGLKRHLADIADSKRHGYSPVNLSDNVSSSEDSGNGSKPSLREEEDYDAPPEHRIGIKTTLIGLILSLGFCVFAVQFSFRGMISISLTIFALVLALLLSIMGVRALGETDLNPVSGISKLTQLLFALATPKDHPNSVVINLLAGAISESGALQAGDLLQDLKTGHLLGASPQSTILRPIDRLRSRRCGQCPGLQTLHQRLHDSLGSFPGPHGLRLDLHSPPGHRPRTAAQGSCLCRRCGGFLGWPDGLAYLWKCEESSLGAVRPRRYCCRGGNV